METLSKNMIVVLWQAILRFVRWLLSLLFPGSKKPGIDWSQPHPKLDPRISFALSVSESRLKEMKSRQLKRLDQLAEEVKQLDDEGVNLEDDKGFHQKLFSPVLHGIYLPELQRLHPDSGRKERYLSGFIKFYGNRLDLEDLGVRVRSRSGDIYTVFVPVRLVAELEAMPAVERIELAKPIFPALDDAIARHLIDALHTAVSPVTGGGVVVGVYDSILDLYHPNFRNDDGAGTDTLGSTRARFLWDQNLTIQAGENTPNDNDASLPWSYGVEYLNADINGELDKPAGTAAYLTVRHGGSTGSHGSRVTGCAAGNGRAVGNLGEAAGTFTGAAPDADIIFVGWRSGHHVDPIGVVPYTDTTFLADGLDYIFSRATGLGLPCVINVSESDDQGPHDGSSLAQQFIDNLLDQPGRALVNSAGNSNERSSHASGTVATGATEIVTLNYAAGADNDDVIQVWYDGHDHISITVNAPTGEVFGPVAAGGVLNTVMTNGEQINITSVIDDPNNHDNLIQIIITASDAVTIPAGAWTLDLTGDMIINGSFNLWVDRNNHSESDFAAPHVTANTLTLGDFGATRRVLTVGSTDKPNDPELVSSFSGRGPTRDGRIKPELTALGRNITTVRSRNMNAADPGDFYTSTSGTSFSSPIVAGTAALLFDCRGAGLNWADIKFLLLDNLEIAGLAIPDNGQGFGRMRAAAICTSPVVDVDVWFRMVPGDLGGEPFGGSFYWESPDIEVLDDTMTPMPNPVHGVDNFIRVTVRNRGTSVARNTEVYLYWGDPATEMPFPDAWQFDGMFTDPDGDGNYTELSNKIVVAEIPAGGDAAVLFRWRPPAPGTNIRGDDHFCLLARAENEADHTDISLGTTWWPLVRTKNNLTARNVHVQEVDGDGDAEFNFWFQGTIGRDRLEILHDLPEVDYELILPAAALPFRDMALVNKLGHPLAFYPADPCGDEIRRKSKMDAQELERIAGVAHAEAGVFDGQTCRVRARASRLVFEEIKLKPRARIPVRIRLSGIKFKDEEHRLRAVQYSDGRVTGGVTLLLRRKS